MSLSADGSRNDGLVSVVIAAYNAERYIAETLHSVLAQNYPLVELIVVDDGSQDATRSVVSSFGEQVRLIGIENSGGASRPRNVGAQHARGEYLLFFDADDLMPTDRVESQLGILNSHPDCQVVVSDYRNFTEQGESPETHFQTCVNLRSVTRDFKRVQLEGGEIQDALLLENFCITSTCMFRREAFIAAGGFDAELFVGEDFELLYRIARRGSVAVHAGLVCRRRLHSTNVSNRLEYNLREKIRTRTKILAGEQNPRRADMLRQRLGELHAGLFQRLSREVPSAALKHLWIARGLGAPLFRVATIKGLIKVLVSSLSLRRLVEKPHGGWSNSRS